jgi:Tfp pilus assembly protein FimT
MGVMMAIAIIQMQPAIQQMRANNAMYLVSLQLRWARQAAIAQRRNIIVEFLGNNEIKLTREEQPAGLTVVSDQFLGNAFTFRVTPGLADTPDGFGNAGAIVFGGAVGGPPIMKFQSDGAFIDINRNPINGTVFLGIPNVSSCARAITVLGATGRVGTFRSTGTGWIK